MPSVKNTPSASLRFLSESFAAHTILSFFLDVISLYEKARVYPSKQMLSENCIKLGIILQFTINKYCILSVK